MTDLPLLDHVTCDRKFGNFRTVALNKEMIDVINEFDDLIGSLQAVDGKRGGDGLLLYLFW